MDEQQRLRATVIRDLILSGWRPPPLPDRAMHRLLDDMVRLTGDRRRDGTDTLTVRERLVLTLYSRGFRAVEIADRIGRAEETVKGQLKSCRRKLGARTSTHAVVLAIMQGVIDPEEDTA